VVIYFDGIEQHVLTNLAALVALERVVDVNHLQVPTEGVLAAEGLGANLANVRHG
jgi:hypothetical protein